MTLQSGSAIPFVVWMTFHNVQWVDFDLQEMPFNDGGEKGDNEVTPIQGDVEAQTPGEKQVKRYRRRAKGDASTEPTGRRGFRETRQSKSTAAPYLAAPPFKVQKMTHEQKKIVDFLIRQPKKDGPTSAE